MKKENNLNQTWILLFFAWVLATIATFGSLFLSDVMMFPPCTLCWYQRIFIYPLVIILLLGLLNNDKNVLNYASPFVGFGWLFAVYHNLLQ